MCLLWKKLYKRNNSSPILKVKRKPDNVIHILKRLTSCLYRKTIDEEEIKISFVNLMQDKDSMFYMPDEHFQEHLNRPG